MAEIGVPPSDTNAEDDVLGAMLANAEALEKMLDLLQPEHFFFKSNAVIFRAMRDVVARGELVDVTSVISQLQTNGDLGNAKGKVRIHELLHNCVATKNCVFKANRVRESWAKRVSIDALRGPFRNLYNGVPHADTLREIEMALLSLDKLTPDENESVVAAFDLAESFQSKMLNPPDMKAGVPGPFHWQSRMQGGRLYVLGGYTADGKTAVALQYLKAAALEGHRVGFVSLEMSWRDLLDRMVASYGVPYNQAQSGLVTSPYLPAANRALKEIARWNVAVLDDESPSVSSIRRQQRIGRFQFLIIDHLHQFAWKDRYELEGIVQSLTNMAREFNIPVLLLCQLRRESGTQSSPFPPPSLSSLKETTKIEQCASQVAFIWRKRDPKTHLPTEEAKYIVAKNRFGPLGDRNLNFRPLECRFEEALVEH